MEWCDLFLACYFQRGLKRRSVQLWQMCAKCRDGWHHPVPLRVDYLLVFRFAAAFGCGCSMYRSEACWWQKIFSCVCIGFCFVCLCPEWWVWIQNIRRIDLILGSGFQIVVHSHSGASGIRMSHCGESYAESLTNTLKAITYREEKTEAVSEHRRSEKIWFEPLTFDRHWVVMCVLSGFLFVGRQWKKQGFLESYPGLDL